MSHLGCFDATSARWLGTEKTVERKRNATANQHHEDSLNRREAISFDTFAACYAWALLSNRMSNCSPDQAPFRHRRFRHRS